MNRFSEWLKAGAETPDFMPAADRQMYSDAGNEIERLADRIEVLERVLERVLEAADEFIKADGSISDMRLYLAIAAAQEVKK